MEAGIKPSLAKRIIAEVKLEGGQVSREAPSRFERPVADHSPSAGKYSTTGAAPHAASESSLFEIGVAVRDQVKQGEIELDDLCQRYRITRAQGYSIMGAVLSGVLDGAMATEAAVAPHSANAEPGAVRLTGKETVLAVGDLHEPFTHPDYFPFIREVAREYRPDVVVFIGDEADHHSLSYHEHDPDGFSAGHEARVTQKRLERWFNEYPEAYVVPGNHSALPSRKAFTAGLPRRMLRTYAEIWNAPATWQWVMDLEIDGVRYLHGDGKSGRMPALSWALDLRQSVVCGHTHTVGGVHFSASYHDLIFGLDVSCGVDQHAYALRYARNHGKRPVLGCGVVKGYGKRPEFIPML